MCGMPKQTFPRDRYDDVPRDPVRVGAHRAPRPRMRWLIVLLWWVLTVAVLTTAGIFAFLALSNTDTIDLPEPTSTTRQSDAPDPVLYTDYFVLVLNGTSDETAGDTVLEQVLGAGWEDDNAVALPSDATDFQTTTVFYVDDEDEAAALGLADELGGVPVTQSSDFDEQSEGGLTVVVGLDRLGDE